MWASALISFCRLHGTNQAVGSTVSFMTDTEVKARTKSSFCRLRYFGGSTIIVRNSSSELGTNGGGPKVDAGDRR